MKSWSEIGASLKTTHVIVSSLIGLIAIGSSVLLRHDANNLMKFVKQNKSLSGRDVDSIVKLSIIPVEAQISNFRKTIDLRHRNDSINASIDKQEMTVVKSSLTDYWKAKKEFDEVVNFQAKLLDALKKNE